MRKSFYMLVALVSIVAAAPACAEKGQLHIITGDDLKVINYYYTGTCDLDALVAGAIKTQEQEGKTCWRGKTEQTPNITRTTIQCLPATK